MNDFALPKSVELVLNSLKNEPKTQKQILKETSLPPRTFRFAISKLRNLGVLKDISSLRDARVKFYKINGGDKNE